MPASSRKRNKGKERKAKQQAKQEETDRLDAHKFWLTFCISSTKCLHGCDGNHCGMISDDHPVTSFMDQFFINAKQKRMNVQVNLSEIFKSHRHIVNNESYRNTVIRIFIRIGTNMMLRNEELVDMSWPLYVGQSIVALEHYYDVDDIYLITEERAVRSKWNDLWLGGSGKRDALKFYRKRTTCKCLKRMHLESRKSETKMGNCYHCREVQERVTLSFCSRCMTNLYCSRECQVADWPRHEKTCDMYVYTHKQYVGRPIE